MNIIKMNKILIKPDGIIDKVLTVMVVLVAIILMVSTIQGPNFENDHDGYEENIIYMD